MRFVSRSKEDPDNVKKSKVIRYDIHIPNYLIKGNMTGPLYRKKWIDFITKSLLKLFNQCEILTDEEYKQLDDTDPLKLWDGRIDSLLYANKKVISGLQREVVAEVSKHPVHIDQLSGKEKTEYIREKSEERIAYMIQTHQICCNQLTENESVYGMKRLRKCMIQSAMQYRLNSPLWKFIVIHLHKGEYRDAIVESDSVQYHLYIPYMFDEGELIRYLKEHVDKFDEIYYQKMMKMLP